jgi:hypothetical protein
MLWGMAPSTNLVLTDQEAVIEIVVDPASPWGFRARAVFPLDMAGIAMARHEALQTDQDIEDLLREFGTTEDYEAWQRRTPLREIDKFQRGYKMAPLSEYGGRRPNPADLRLFRHRFEYALTRRPATSTTVPKGFLDLGPATGEYPHGTVAYAKPLSRDALESFELEPLDPEDPMVMKRALSAYRDEVYERFSDTGGFEQLDAEGRHTTLSRSTRAGVEYQVTYWLADWTPTGHLDIDDFDEAVSKLWGSVPKAERRQRQEDAVWRHRRRPDPTGDNEVYYSAIFLDEASQQTVLAWWERATGVPLLRQIYSPPHMTLQVRPSAKDVAQLQIGQQVRMRVVGWVADEIAQAVRVEPEMVVSKPNPHVTIATIGGPGSPASHSNELFAAGFTRAAGPTLTGVVGTFSMAELLSRRRPNPTGDNDDKGLAPYNYEPVESEQSVGKADTSTRYIGLCAVCEGRVKVQSNRLVHHGYRRPGVGYIIGDCFGVGREPHELSDTCARVYLDEVVGPYLEKSLRRFEYMRDPPTMEFRYLERAESGYMRWAQVAAATKAAFLLRPMTIEELITTRIDEHAQRERYGTHATGDATPTPTRVIELMARDEWVNLLRITRHEADRELGYWTAEQARMSKLVSTWKPQPLVTVEEDIASKQGARRGRESARDLKNREAMSEAMDKFRARLDSGVKNRNARLVTDLFTSGYKAYQSLSNRPGQVWVTREDFLRLADRDAVWTAFGLLRDGEYVGAKPKGAPWDLKYEAAINKAMDVWEANWPKALGGGRTKKARW